MISDKLPYSALRRALAAVLVAGALSCTDGPTAPRPLAFVTATPEALSLRPLDTLTVVARVLSLEGIEIPGRPLVWRSLDTTIATVDSTGVVTASAYTGPAIRNTAILVTTLGASTDTVPVEVLPWAVARVIASPSELTISPRDSAELALRLESEAGLELTDRTIAWIADDTNVVQVNAAGRVRARLYTGPLSRQTWIVGFSEGQSDSVRVTVPPLAVSSITLNTATTALVPGQLDTLSAVVRSADGQALTETPLTWSSSDTTIARVNEEGVITAMFYAGFETRVASVIVQFGSVADTALVEVRPLAVARVEFFEDTIGLRPGTTYRPSVTLYDAAGVALVDRPVTWSSADPLVATVSDSGEIATQPYASILTRTARIIAASAGAADTFRVTVRPHTVQFVVVSPERLTLQPLDSAQLTPHLESLFGDTLVDRTVVYLSMNTTVVGVQADGKVFAAAYTGDSVRATEIIATSGLGVDTIPVEVLPLAVASVVVTPSSVTLPPRGTDSLAIAALSAGGVPLSGRASAWVSSDTAVVQVSATGVITARPYFGPLERTVQIVGFSAGLADTAIVSVQPLVPASLQLSAATLALSPSAVDTLSALLRSATNDTLTEFPLTWRSTDSTVARVNEEGIVTALYYAGAEVRSTSIIVSMGTLADTASVQVVPLPVGSVAIVAPATTVNPGSTLQLDASVRDAADLVLSDRPIDWTSSDTSRARVSATGLVTALPYGGADARTVQIIASSESVADTVSLTLPPLAPAWLTATPEVLNLQPLDTTTITARVESFNLTELVGRTVSFASLDTTVVRVDTAGHVVAAAYTGPTVRFSAIVLTSGAAVDTVPVTITPFAVARVIATPSAVTIAVGDSTTLTAATESENGITLSEREFAWISSDTAVAQVSATGVVRARPYAGPLERSVFIVVFSGGLADTATVTVTPRTASSIEVTPANISLLPGGVDTLAAAVRTAEGNLLADFPLTWTSSDTLVARVNVAGVVTAQFYVGAATRTAQVVVATGALADTSNIEVLPLAVASVSITPDSGTLLPGATFQLDASLRDADGLLLADRVTTWSSLSPAIATVNASGLVTAAAFSGTATRAVAIVAASGTAADTITLTIPPHPVGAITATPEALSLFPLDTITVTPTLTALDLTVLSDRAVTWTSLDTTIAVVNSAGRVTASAYAGAAVRSTALVASSGGATDTVPVTVTPLAVARIIASPSTLSLAVGDSAALTAATESGNGTPLSGREFVWISSDTAVVQVSALGVARARPYTGPLERTALIVVFSGGVADTASITVTPLSANAIEVTPSSLSLLPGRVDTLGTAVRTAGGDLLTDFPLLWSSTDTTVARVNVEGIVTASFYVGAATRTAQVIVSTGALADTASIEVLPLTVATVTIAPDSGTVLPGGTFQLDASLRDVEGLLLTDRVTTWTSLDSTIASVDASGLVTALPFGGTATRTVGIVASNGSAADTITMTVPPLDAAWLTATPEALSLQPLDTTTVTARVESLNFTELTGRTIAFTSLDPAVATVTESGLVGASAYTGPLVRSTAIVVTSGAATDTVPVTVTPLAVARVIASPSAVTLTIGDSTTLTAVTESANGTTLSDRDFVWLSSDTSVVQVSEAGLVRAQPYAGPEERSALVVVYSGGVADTTTVTVTPLVAGSVQVSATSASLVPGLQTTLSASVRTAGGDLLSGFPLSWSSTDTTVVRVNADGIVTAQFYVGAATRNALVIVATGALADTASIEVTPLVVDSVAITPQTGELLPGATFLLDAALRDAEGLLLEGRTTTWTSLSPAVATVNASGLVTASAFGGTATRTVEIVAASGTVADTITLTIPPHPVAAVTATPEALSLFPLDTTTVLATVTALDLTVLADRALTWSSLNEAVATVDLAGLVTATAYTGPSVRSTAIVVTSATATDTIPVTVSPFAVATLSASPSTLSLAPDDTATLSLALEAANGTMLTERNRLWLSADTSIVSVDSLTGLVTARPYAGALERNVDVVVYSEGKADTVAVTIAPLVPASIAVTQDTVLIFPGEQATLGATLRSASDTVLTGRTITWTSTDPTVATVNADGVVLGLFYVGPDERTTQVIAENGVLADTALIRVRALLVDSIAIFPDTQTLQAAQTAQLSAVLRDSAGLFLNDRPIQWTSSDPSRATVSDSGLVSALVAGTVTITATSGSASDTATITIVPVVTNVRVTPELSTVWIGREQPLSVALLDTNGVVPANRSVTWTSSNPAIATVDTAGVVTALSTGLVTIVATSEGRADTISIDVFPEPTAAVTITFDDSWRGVLELAYPVMQDLRLRANVGWITSVNWAGVMNPTELRVLQDAGWSIVSHSMSHPFLTQIPIDSARFELEGSRARIDSLGFDPRVFIAPYLDHNDAVLTESAAAGYTYTRCCAEDTWSTDTLVSWPIQAAARHRLAGVDVTNYDGQISSYNFRTADGRTRLRNLLLDVVAEGKFLDVFFHDVLPEDVPDLRLTMEILAEFRPYLITYGMLP